MCDSGLTGGGTQRLNCSGPPTVQTHTICHSGPNIRGAINNRNKCISLGVWTSGMAFAIVLRGPYLLFMWEFVRSDDMMIIHIGPYWKIIEGEFGALFAIGTVYGIIRLIGIVWDSPENRLRDQTERTVRFCSIWFDIALSLIVHFDRQRIDVDEMIMANGRVDSTATDRH